MQFQSYQTSQLVFSWQKYSHLESVLSTLHPHHYKTKAKPVQNIPPDLFQECQQIQLENNEYTHFQNSTKCHLNIKCILFNGLNQNNLEAEKRKIAESQ